MKTLQLLIHVALVLLTCPTTHAQDKWSVELRPSLDFPNKDSAEFKTGFGFEAAVGYRFMEHLGAYFGWGYHTFNSDTPLTFPGTGDNDFDVTGYTFGLQFIHPIGRSDKLSYLVRLGGIYNRIEVEDTIGQLIAEADHGLGWQIGAGLQIELGGHWNLRPQLGYSALSSDLQVGAMLWPMDLNYLSFGMGVAKRF